MASRIAIPTSLVILSALFACGGGSGGDDDINLQRLARLPLAGFVTDVWGYVDDATGTEYALVGFGLFSAAADTGSGVHIVDVSDPRKPVRVSTVNTVPGFDVKAWKNYIYTVDGGSVGQGKIVDASDPAQPQVVGSFPSAHNIFIAANGFMYCEADAVQAIYDLNDSPTDPVLVWQGSDSGHDATVIGDRWYHFGSFGATDIFDVSDPSLPRLLASIDLPSIAFHHSGWVTDDGNFLFITDELADLRGAPADFTVWDISDLDNPEKVGEFADANATVHNLFVRGDFAYVSYYHAGLRIFDVSNPSQPVIVDEFDTSTDSGPGFGGAFGVYPFAPSGNIYVSDEVTGLHVFSFKRGDLPSQSNPLAP